MRMQILNVPCGCTFVLVCAHLCMHVLVLVAKSNTTNVKILIKHSSKKHNAPFTEQKLIIIYMLCG